MKKFENVRNRISSVILPVCFFVLSMGAAVAQGNAEAGAKLFDANCTSCHSGNLTKDATGPALFGIADRAPSKEWINEWIKNNNTLRASGDVYANKIYNDWGGAAMTAFEWMSDQQLNDVVEYIVTWAPKPKGGADAGNGLMPCVPEKKQEEESHLFMIIGIIGLSLLIIVIFTGVNRSLKNAKAIKNGGEAEEPKSFWEAIADFAVNQKIKFGLIVIGFLVLGFIPAGWEDLMNIGVFGGNGFEKTENVENYHPTQPIEFRHDIHAGQNEIDCKYCHSGTLDSKHALIPSANVCMNCHTYVNEKEDCPESAEKIQQIYDAVKFTHGKGYYDVDEKGNPVTNAEGEIVYSDEPVAEGDPIEWVKVHNLQDFVYFNHSQHVVVGGLECQECHGPMETMQTAEQYAPLTMGWCIECHREKEINQELKLSGKPNGYYEKMHDEFKEAFKRDEKFDFTVEKIGGLECAKCHY